MSTATGDNNPFILVHQVASRYRKKKFKFVPSGLFAASACLTSSDSDED